MDDFELERYSRHILLPEIDIAGQERLSKAAVLIVGAGGLGSPAAMYLASSGIGKITVCDDDTVDLGNLQRQILYRTDDIGKYKAAAAAAALHAINPLVDVRPAGKRLTESAMQTVIRDHDVVVDASDNFETRFALNTACHAECTPLVSGAAIGFRGQVSVFRLDRDGSPCLQCLYPAELNDQETGDCSANGVFAPLTGIIGSILAAETIKLLTGFGAGLDERLLLFDSASMTFRCAALSKDPACPVCSNARRVLTTGA